MMASKASYKNGTVRDLQEIYQEATRFLNPKERYDITISIKKSKPKKEGKQS